MKSTATTFLRATVMASVLAATSLFAGTPAPSSKSVVVPQEPPENPWYFTAAAYGWLGAVNGDVGVGPILVSADTSINDVLDEFDGAAMAYFEVGYERWSLGLDLIWSKLKDDSSIERGPVSGTASFEQEQAVITFRLQYALVKNEATRIDAFVGGRWMYIDIDIGVDTNFGPGRHFGLTEDWIDPIVGARIIHNFSDKCYVQAMGDIGGFGAESELTWQALAGLGYRFTPKLSTMVGYRALGVDYDKDQFILDTISHGPFLGLSYTF